MKLLSEFDIEGYNWNIVIFSRNRRHEGRVNDIITFDIETTSLYKDDDGVYRVYSYVKDIDSYYTNRSFLSVPYLFQVGINDVVYYTRNIWELKKFFINLSNLGLKFYIYVHNLSFEFTYLLNLSKVEKEFSRKAHAVIYAIFEEFNNIQFRCSYFLTRMSLEEWGKTVGVAQKQVGKLDYLVFRTPLTPLTENEMLYAEYDCLVMYYGLKEKLEKYKHIWDIPLTQTGEIRKVVKKLCIENKYDKVAVKCQPSNLEVYRMMLNCTWGGETHANYINTDFVLKNLRSVDYESSYPFCMCVYKYPHTPFFRHMYTEKNKNDYMFMLHLRFKKIKAKHCLHSIPIAKCKIKGKVVKDNGRIIEAEELEIKCLDLDYETIGLCYTWEEVNIIDSWASMGREMPDFFVRYVIERFAEKTKYKNVKGFEMLYRTSKEFNNAIYGMSITRLIFDEFIFDNEEFKWKMNEEKMDEEWFEKELKKRLKYSSKNFLQYSFGMYCVAYGRRNLWKLLLGMPLKDVVYYDTDSDKYIDSEQARLHIASINEEHRNLLVNRARKIGLTEDIYNPTDPEGGRHMLGQLDDDGKYLEFKTLGAKKYAYVDEEGIHTVVSGLPKSASEFFNSLDEFKKDITIPALQSHKNVIQYNYTQELNIKLEDGYVTELSCGACVRPNEYSISISQDFSQLLGHI